MKYHLNILSKSCSPSKGKPTIYIKDRIYAVFLRPITGQVAALFFFGFSSIFNISENQCKNISGAKTSGVHLTANIIHCYLQFVRVNQEIDSIKLQKSKHHSLLFIVALVNQEFNSTKLRKLLKSITQLSSKLDNATMNRISKVDQLFYCVNL